MYNIIYTRIFGPPFGRPRFYVDPSVWNLHAWKWQIWRHNIWMSCLTTERGYSFLVWPTGWMSTIETMQNKHQIHRYHKKAPLLWYRGWSDALKPPRTLNVDPLLVPRWPLEDNSFAQDSPWIALRRLTTFSMAGGHDFISTFAQKHGRHPKLCWTFRSPRTHTLDPSFGT